MIELLELSQVLKAVESTGTEVRYYDAECATSKASGWYELSSTVDRLVICPRNHINHSDLLDTVRHEAIHVIQACYGGPLQNRAHYDKYATQEIKDTVLSNYPETDHHHELEAFTAAKFLSEQDIVNSINRYCFN